MKRTVCAVALLSAGMALAYPKINPETVRLAQDQNRTATISYTLENEDAVVTVAIEVKDSGGNWKALEAPLDHLSGDCWKRLAPGAHTIVWKARRDWPDQLFQDNSVRAVVTAWPLASPPDYMVLDLTDFTQTFYPSTNAFPKGLSDISYRTTKLVMRKIPAEGATFLMGQPTDSTADKSCVKCFLPPEATPHLVSFSNDYYMAIYETTQGQHKRLRNENDGNSCDVNNEKPVDAVAMKTLRGLDAAPAGIIATMQTNSGLPLDLPTEAEWEFACRAGTDTAFSNGENFTTADQGCKSINDIAWTLNNRPADAQLTYKNSAWIGGIHIVGLKKPNAWGLYDMHGNASEWCRDWANVYVTTDQPLLNPEYSTGTAVIKRGGNWYVAGVYAASSARRYTKHPDYALEDACGANVWANGYRLVCPVIVK